MLKAVKTSRDKDKAGTPSDPGRLYQDKISSGRFFTGIKDGG